MDYEIERKFLVASQAYRDEAFHSFLIAQGYLSTAEECTIRVRIEGEKAEMTVKARVADTDFTRYEWNYPLPPDRAMELMALCQGRVIEKRRYLVKVQEQVFMVDEFQGKNQGLVVAELELKREDEPYTAPDWLGEEITHDARYFNSYLSEHPYSEW